MRNFKRNPDGSPMKTKLGITVNRKLGKACKRNRVKRLIREAYRENYSYIKDGYIMVIAARAAAFAAIRGQAAVGDSAAPFAPPFSALLAVVAGARHPHPCAVHGRNGFDGWLLFNFVPIDKFAT